jgi:hypothetical protein
LKTMEEENIVAGWCEHAFSHRRSPSHGFTSTMLQVLGGIALDLRLRTMYECNRFIITHYQLDWQDTQSHVASRIFTFHFLVQRSSPPLLNGLALRPRPPSRLDGSHPPPPPSALAGLSLLSNRCPTRSEATSSFDASRRCIKLQKPPRLHSPFSF